MENRNTPRPENPPARVRAQPVQETDIRDDEPDAGAGETRGVENESDLRLGGDTGFDRVVGPAEAGLGGGLDQAEEAQLGITDEELEKMARDRGTPDD